MHNSNLIVGQIIKIIVLYPRAKITCFYSFKWCICQQKKLKAQYFGLSGPNSMLLPHLARGPYVVYAALDVWLRLTFFTVNSVPYNIYFMLRGLTKETETKKLNRGVKRSSKGNGSSVKNETFCKLICLFYLEMTPRTESIPIFPSVPSPFCNSQSVERCKISWKIQSELETPVRKNVTSLLTTFTKEHMTNENNHHLLIWRVGNWASFNPSSNLDS